jgi:hypothetical protein
MKDFYDIYKILNESNFSTESLEQAIKQTFRARRTKLPEYPAIFSPDFLKNPRNRNLWQAFLRRIKAEYIPFEAVLSEIKNNLEPIYAHLRQGM